LAESLSPAMALESLNALAVRTHKEMVATLLYVVIDTDAGEARFASAGHPPPLLMSADGKARYLEHRHAPPLGVTAHTHFEDSPAEFGPGATLLLYTDGVVERRGEILDVGLERLRDAVLAGPQALDALCSQVLRVALNGAGVPDDAALLAVRRVPQSPHLKVRLPAEPESLAVVRERLGRWLTEGGADPDERFAVTVAANEACANAVVHAYGPRPGPTMSLVGKRAAGSITIEVSDSGRWRAPRGRGGRGLDLMERLMDEVHVSHGEAGTTVRLRKNRPPAAQEPSA
jgi:anti-sigma regulatory factor (Ser/Thr protein kinase)